VFELSTFWLIFILCAVVGGSAALGILLGRRAVPVGEGRASEATGVLQATLLGFVGLLMAFGLSLAIGRYEGRRDVVADEANTIGTTYLRAQTIPEPMRSRSLVLLRRYTDVRIGLSNAVPDSRAYTRFLHRSVALQNRLWSDAGKALDQSPSGSAVRLYVESLNEMIDADATRQETFASRVPDLVMWLQITGASAALAALGFHLARTDRSVTVLVASTVVVIFILLVTFDLDRPVRGFVTIPDTLLVDLRHEMSRPPAAAAPV
jgi:hypothetical protein